MPRSTLETWIRLVQTDRWSQFLQQQPYLPSEGWSKQQQTEAWDAIVGAMAIWRSSDNRINLSPHAPWTQWIGDLVARGMPLDRGFTVKNLDAFDHRADSLAALAIDLEHAPLLDAALAHGTPEHLHQTWELPRGETATLFTCSRAWPEGVRRLLQAGYPMARLTDSEEMPWDRHVVFNDPTGGVLQAVLQNGLSPNACLFEDRLPLLGYARTREQVDVLHRAGADLNARDAHGTPVLCSTARSYDSTLVVIRKVLDQYRQTLLLRTMLDTQTAAAPPASRPRL